MARFDPAVEVVLHDVAVGAGLGIVGEIGRAFGVHERVSAEARSFFFQVVNRLQSIDLTATEEGLKAAVWKAVQWARHQDALMKAFANLSRA